MSRRSRLLSEAELEALYKRLNGDYSDPQGLFSARVRPKIKELIAWSNPKLKRQLHRALVQKRKRDLDDTPAEPL